MSSSSPSTSPPDILASFIEQVLWEYSCVTDLEDRSLSHCALSECGLEPLDTSTTPGMHTHLDGVLFRVKGCASAPHPAVWHLGRSCNTRFYAGEYCFYD